MSVRRLIAVSRTADLWRSIGCRADELVLTQMGPLPRFATAERWAEVMQPHMAAVQATLEPYDTFVRTDAPPPTERLEIRG